MSLCRFVFLITQKVQNLAYRKKSIQLPRQIKITENEKQRKIFCSVRIAKQLFKRRKY